MTRDVLSMPANSDAHTHKCIVLLNTSALPIIIKPRPNLALDPKEC